jgi:hypothetical protein
MNTCITPNRIKRNKNKNIHICILYFAHVHISLTISIRFYVENDKLTMDASNVINTPIYEPNKIKNKNKNEKTKTSEKIQITLPKTSIETTFTSNITQTTTIILKSIFTVSHINSDPIRLISISVFYLMDSPTLTTILVKIHPNSCLLHYTKTSTYIINTSPLFRIQPAPKPMHERCAQHHQTNKAGLSSVINHTTTGLTSPNENLIQHKIQKNKRFPPRMHLLGGGINQDTSSAQTIQSTQFIYPIRTQQNGPLSIAIPTMIYNHHFTPQWTPPSKLDTLVSDHPLSNLLTKTNLRQIILYCQETPQLTCAYSTLSPIIAVTTEMFRHLITHGSPIHDNVISLFLEALCTRFDMCFLAPQFLPLLLREGWSRTSRYFATQRKPRSIFRPQLTGEQVIAIPCFIDDCHWIPLVRREHKGRVMILYADDLNNTATEVFLKETLSKTSTDFFPPDAQWIHCHSYTYQPHSNECGPRTLLALTIMMLHPNPDQYILLPFMHHNLANLTRTWVASTIITGLPLIPLLTSTTQNVIPNSNIAISKPSYIVPWHENPAMEPNSFCLQLASQPTPLDIDYTLEISTINPHLQSTTLQEIPFHPPLELNTPLSINTSIGSISSALTSSTPTQQLSLDTTRFSGPSDSTSHYAPARRKTQTNITQDRTQPKITKYFLPTSRQEPSPPQEATSTIKTKNKIKNKNKTVSQPTYQPLPTLFDLPLLQPLTNKLENELPIWGHSLETIDPEKTLRIIL